VISSAKASAPFGQYSGHFEGAHGTPDRHQAVTLESHPKGSERIRIPV
jgi:hypothetical protein